MAAPHDTAALPVHLPAEAGAWRRVRRELRSVPVLLALAVLALMTLMALFAPWLGTADPTAIAPGSRLKPPFGDFPFGTDAFGRDVWSRVAYGARVSLAAGLGAALASTVAGLALGVLAGWFRWLDGPIMRVMDALMAIPGILLAIALVSVSGASLATVLFAITLPEIPRVVRLVRGQILSVRGEPYVEAALALGTPLPQLVWRHLLPGTVAPLTVQATYVFASAMLTEAILGFLGAGVPPEIASWGNIMSEGRMFFRLLPGLILFPGLFLSLTVLSINILGDALRDAFDPRTLPARGARGPTAAPQPARHAGNAAHDRAPVLSLRGLTVQTADAAQVVRGLNLDVHAGETVCVVGESGSGKSVTALAVMGLLPRGALAAASGAILLRDEDVLAASPRRLRELRATRMAMVFQEPMTALNPVHRVGRQVDEVLRLHRRMARGDRRARVLEMFRAVHLPDPERIYDAYPHELSGGQRQRIVIAMALILEPALLIADEPTTALDVTTQRQILALIRELQRRHGTAVLFITHDFGVVAEIADRIVVMNRGDLIETGTRGGILARPAHHYTRRLVSSVPSLAPVPRAPLQDDVVLRVRGLGRTYASQRMLPLGRGRSVVAASGVDLTLRRGEILGLVGESGSGKSTVARCVARLIAPTRGSLLLGASDLARLSGAALRPMRKRVQIIFQDPYRSLNPRRVVGDSLIEGLLNFGMPRGQAQARAVEMLGLVGIGPDALRRYPHQFSGGQRQRLCIARALVMEPQVLVADEAVSALDVSVQAQVLDLLETVRQRTGISILFITHDLRVAAQVCDTIAVMLQGRVVEAGAAHTVLVSPQHDYTRTLLQAAPGRDWDFRNFRPLRAG